MDTFLKKEIIAPLIIVFVTFLLCIIANKVVKRIFKIQSKTKKGVNKNKVTIALLVNNIVRYLLIIIAILMILEVYGIDTKSLIASLGVVGLVAGLALQDTLKDFISGITIVFENQYRVGDTVTISGFKGEVIFLGLKTTRIMAYTGEVKIIANRLVTDVVNHSIADSLAIVDVGVSYDSDLDKVEKVLNKLCVELTQTLSDLKGEVTCIGINSFEDSSIIYRITAPTVAMAHFEIQRKIHRAIKDAFDKNKISIPYPQVVIHNG